MSSQLNTINKPSLNACISLGSNQESASGTALETLTLAIAEIERLSVAPIQQSSFYLTEPVECAPGTAEFINAAVVIEVADTCDPLSLLQSLHEIEAKFGRSRSGGVNAPRPLDLDLICISGIEIKTSSLVLPHPRAHERLFVLMPLAEINPRLQLAQGQPTISELIQGLPSRPWVKQL
ncbi:MAG: 2-amino-4-hydroxy-6-hydroxymethyldihydropteridine diphosphokinase [Pseudohongiellaceae bacterium]|jgi:2-amino-4-hydroxy-6-hydroxymethyldihydropteridine diphosphokinase